MNLDLPLIFAALMALAMLAYVILDGFDLGVGALMPFTPRAEHDLMVAAIGPYWDANETWLVLGVGILLVAFPAAHGVILGELYLPVALMLVALILRGVAFELRVKAEGWHRELWNRLFMVGSIGTAFAQGVMLAGLITGFANGPIAIVFALLVGAGLTGGYALLGATWLVLKAEGEIQRRAIRLGRTALLLTALGIGLVSLATPWASERIYARWFEGPQIYWLVLLPLLTVVCLALTWRELGAVERGIGRESRSFVLACLVFLLAFVGLGYSLFPYLVVDRLTIWDAAASADALWITFVGAAVVLPIIIAYTVIAYRIFWGKARLLSYSS